ncbi:MAG: spermidine synthase, partial [Dehalococcoidia bacterium]
QRVILYLLVSSSFFIGLTPFLFYRLADGLALSQIQNWAQYVFALAALSIATLLVPGIILGMIFPFTLKLIQSSNRSIGSSLGNWISLNLIGGITGSILAGFVFISFFGVLYGIFLLAVLYPVAALLLSDSRLRPAYRALAVGAPVLVALYFTTITDPLHLNPEKNEVLLEQYQSGYGTTSVIKSHSPHFPKNFDDLFIRLNNYYTLGGTGSIANEKRQAHLPLLLHPNPESVYILGMGTGLTAGAALDHPLQRLVVAEINPDVIQASQDYFREFNNGLFADPRVQVVSRDGRTYLHGTAETYDVIIGDLYNPTTRGISNLYTREHFQNVKDHLREDGLFAQWLPLYQLSEEDFSIITGTFLEVFPDATVWRGNFLADKPVLALVSGDNLSFDTMRQNIEALSQRVEDEELIDLLVSTKGLGILTINPSSKEQLSAILPDLIESIPYTFYAGQLSQEQYADTTINRDDFPIVEYLSPKNRSFEYAADSSFLTGHALNEFYNALATTQGNDSVLEDLTEQEREYVRAGNVYYKSVLFEFDAILANAAEPRIKSQEYLAEYLNSIGLD